MHCLPFHCGFRAWPRARQGPRGTGWKPRAKASGFYFSVLGRPGALGLIAELGAPGSAPWKPLTRFPKGREPKKLGRAGREGDPDQYETEAQMLSAG